MVKLGINVLGAGIYDSAKFKKDMTVSLPRVVTYYEMSFFIEDGGSAFVNGQEYQLKKGSVLLRKPGDVLWFRLHFLCEYVHFTVDEPTLQPLLDSMPTCFFPDRFEEHRRILQNMFLVQRSEDTMAPVALSGGIMQLLWNLHMRGAQIGQVRSRNPVRKAVKLIQKNYNEQLSVEQMARSCNLSVSHFHKLFVKTTGTTPNRYLMLCRLNAAKVMLQSGNCSVAQIAESCGFSSQGYFCDCMKRYTGMSPRQFRRVSNYPEGE